MHTVLDNLSDHRGHALNGKKTGSFFFFLFLATWKDILHLAHISWILKQNLRAEQKKKKKSEKHKNTQQLNRIRSHTPTACVSEIYCTWVILLLILNFSFLYINVLQLCESSLWQNQQSSAKRGSTVSKFA